MTKVMIPVDKVVLDKLWENRTANDESWTSIVSRLISSQTEPTDLKHSPRIRQSACAVEILGERRQFHTAIDGLVWLLDTLAGLDETVMPKLAQRVAGRSRNHISRTQASVYPLRPDLSHGARLLKSGWYLGSNISNRDKRKIVSEACQALGLSFGRDVKYTTE